MSFRIGGLPKACIASAVLLAGVPALASAQTTYPSFQQSRIVSREFNFGVADGDGITPIVFQWREGTTPWSQLSLDVGLADSEAQDEDVSLILGGQYAHTLARSNADIPLDILFTAGLFTQFGNGTLLAVPVGASVGHRFLIEGTALAITPYIHPRVAFQYVKLQNVPAGIDDSDSDIDVSFDVGGSLELTPRFAIRVSATFGNFDAIGISFAFAPRALRTASAPAGGTR